MAVGTVVITEKIINSVKKIKFAWTSGTGAESGTASGETTNLYDGKIVVLTTVPGAVAVPTLNYDITITDEDGVDVLAGGGANRSDTAIENVTYASLGAVSKETLTINIAAAGSAKTGVAYLYIR